MTMQNNLHCNIFLPILLNPVLSILYKSRCVSNNPAESLEFCKDINLFYWISFEILTPLWCGWQTWMWGVALSSIIVPCDQNEAAYQTMESPSIPCLGQDAAESKHTLAFMRKELWNWPTKVIGCTEYEQNPLNIVGFRMVTKDGQADRRRKHVQMGRG